ncbi:MAG: outer membrane beta-barrel domain-containing protein [Deltaproteobacteria bacterium]|nr:outer membrane beta-barrel domain-containing protein [Deltaproteobacteria bacterium]
MQHPDLESCAPPRSGATHNEQRRAMRGPVLKKSPRKLFRSPVSCVDDGEYAVVFGGGVNHSSAGHREGMLRGFGTWILASLLLSHVAFAADPEAASKTANKVDEDASKEADTTNDKASTSTGLTLQERIRAVSNPVFAKDGRFAVTPFLGFSANDAFFERMQVGSRFNYHLFEWLSLEGGGALNYASIPLPTIRVVSGGEGPDIEDPNPLLSYFDVNATLSPIYGKTSVMSEWVLHFDAFVTAGVGGIITLPTTGVAFSPAVSIGFGANFVVLEWLTLRVELRDYLYPTKIGSDGTAAFGGTEIQNLLLLNLGAGFYFPFEVEREDIGVVKVNG